MNNAKPDLRALFCEALDRKSPEELATYLDAACGGDADLRVEVEALLASHREGGDFLGGASASCRRTLDPTPVERPGTQIGPYKLLQEIGEGGMGIVYMAEQHEPVRRKVALKIIKPGMDSRQVIARFEAERQALSLMEHPNIARVLDAGTTDSGRPYFAMELVKGQPITEYCDEHQLTPRQRLEMLLPVCHAIQHAHQKGVIHRDIKPSNILVAEYDQQAVPKVIDFGVAKATSQPLTDKTMFTGYGQIVGTLEYMSPEQAKVNQLDIDTRSDIYSLGVLMYELLTGSTPFDKRRLQSAAWDEMLRIIREEEPPKPSTRLVDSQDTLASISAQRQTEPAKLTKLVRGELDWIVMKALEKDRSRRYETANGLATDIQRHLHDEPVAACPPSASYRFRKFASRNKTLLSAVSMTLVTLLAGCIVSWVLLLQARNAKVLVMRAEQQLWDSMFALAEEHARDWKHDVAADAFASLLKIERVDSPETERDELRATLGLATALTNQGRFTDAVADLSQVTDSLRVHLDAHDTQAAGIVAQTERLFDAVGRHLIERGHVERDVHTAQRLAESILDTAPSAASSLPSTWFVLGWTQYVNRDWSACRDSLNQCFCAGGDSMQLWLLMAMTQASLDTAAERARGRQWFLAFQDRQRKTFIPPNYAWHRPLTLLLEKSTAVFPADGQPATRLTNAEALQLFQSLLGEYPQSAWLHNRCGGYLARLGKWQEALTHFEYATQCEPDYWRHWIERGVTCLQLDDRQGYEATCWEAIQGIKSREYQPDLVLLCTLTPASPIPLDRLSKVAEDAYSQRLNERAGRVYLAKGLKDYRCGHYPDAIDALLNSYTTEARAGIANAFLAMSYSKMGNREKALEVLERARTIAQATVPDPVTSQTTSYEEEAPIMRVMLDLVLAESAELITGQERSETPSYDGTGK